MANPDATITLELNAGAANADLARFAQNAQTAGATVGKSFAGASEHGEKLLMSSHRVATQMGHLAKSLVGGGGAADIFAAGLEGLERSLHLPLGTLGGLAVFGVVGEQIIKAREEAIALRAETEKLTVGQGAPEFQTTASIEGHMQAVQAQIARIKEKPTYGNGSNDFENAMADPAGFLGSAHIFGGHGYDAVLKDRQDQIDALRLQQAQGVDALSEKTGDETSVTATRLNVGEFAAQRAEIQKKMREEIGDNSRNIDVTTTAGGGAKLGELNDAVRARAAVEMEAVNRREQAQERAIALEGKLAGIQRGGADVEVQSAKARLEAAQAEMNAAPAEEKNEKSGAVAAAAAEYDLAKRTRAEKLAQVDLETRIANLAGPQLEVKRQTLALERQALEDRLARAREDEKPEIDRDLARNAQESRDLALEQETAWNDSTAAAINANTAGPTVGDQRQRFQEMIALYKTQIDQLMDPHRAGGPDLDQAAKVTEQLAAQQAGSDAFEYSQKNQLDREQAITAEMNLQVQGYSQIADQARTLEEYEEKIRDARHAGQDDLAAEYETQKKMALLQMALTTTYRSALSEQDAQRNNLSKLDAAAARARDERDKQARGVRRDGAETAAKRQARADQDAADLAGGAPGPSPTGAATGAHDWGDFDRAFHPHHDAAKIRAGANKATAPAPPSKFDNVSMNNVTLHNCTIHQDS